MKGYDLRAPAPSTVWGQSSLGGDVAPLPGPVEAVKYTKDFLGHQLLTSKRSA